MEIEIRKSLSFELFQFKQQHYNKVFKAYASEVFQASKVFQDYLILQDGRNDVAACAVDLQSYYVKFSDFVVLPEFRAKGYGRKMIETLENMAQNYQKEMLHQLQKQYTGSQMHLQSEIHPVDLTEMPGFLKHMGFTSFPYEKEELNDAEIVAERAFKQGYHGIQLALFKKQVLP